jgi:alpha-L-fucosidase
VLPDSELAGPGGAVVRIELAPRAAETRIDFFHGLNI